LFRHSPSHLSLLWLNWRSCYHRFGIRASMRLVILHYHLFKNAGSTIEDILDHSFGGRFGSFETPADRGVLSNDALLGYLEERPGVVAFSSHQIRYPMPVAPGCLFFDICFVRDPLDRLRSFYDYFRQRPNPADPMSDLANSMTLGDFVETMIRGQPLFVRNNQVNLLACCGDSDEPGEQDLELAIRRMRACAFPGVVDDFEQSVAVGAERLRQAFPELDCQRPAVNVSRGMQGTVADRVVELQAACRPEVFEELVRMTALDRRLVEAVRAEVERRRAEVHVGGCLPARATTAPAGSGDPGFFTRAKQLIGTLRYWRELGVGSLLDGNYYRPGVVFDPAFYLRKYPDVAAAGVNPWLHYLRNGAVEDRKPHPLFDPKYYRASCKGGIPDGVNPLMHFLGAGAGAASPHPLFDCRAYLEAHSEVAELGLNPLVHYLESDPEVATDSTAQFEINDLPLNFLPLNAAGEAGATVWEDAGGITHWVAEPQQLPFLRGVGIDQVRSKLR